MKIIVLDSLITSKDKMDYKNENIKFLEQDISKSFVLENDFPHLDGSSPILSSWHREDKLGELETLHPVLERDIQQRLEILGEHRRFHHHGIATGDEEIAHLGVQREVAVKLLRVGRGEFEFLVPDELRPTETEGAVAVTGLTLRWEKQLWSGPLCSRFTIVC